MITHLLKRVLPFLLTLVLGTGMWNVFGTRKTSNRVRHGHRCTHERMFANEPTPVRILSRTEERYIPEGPGDEETGVVRLLLRFNPDGTTTVIERLSSTLPERSTTRAIGAAWQIRFIPATVNGEFVAQTRVITYVFALNDNANYVFTLSDDKIKTNEP